jgi:flagellar biosynthetic protein FliR
MDWAIGFTFLLVFVRVTTMVVFLPLIGSGMGPGMVKALFGFCLAILMFPFAQSPPTPVQTVEFLVMVAGEVLFGALMGFSARVIVKVLRMVGEITGRQMGMALSKASDPVRGVRTTVVGNFCNAIGVLMLFVSGTHLLLLRGIKKSLVSWPVGRIVTAEFVRKLSLSAVSQAFTATLQIAAPILLVTFLISLVMAIMARLVPEINVLVVGMPLRVGAGLLLLMFFVPVMVKCGREVCELAARAFTSYPVAS